MQLHEPETFGTTSGLRQTTRRRPISFKARLLGFSAALVIVAFLIVRFDTNIWRAQSHLRESFAAIKAEKFYFGVNFRVNLRKLTATLLDFQSTGNKADLEAFLQEAQELKEWLRQKQGNFVSPEEVSAFGNLESAYQLFLKQTDSLLQTNGLAQTKAPDFALAYSKIREAAVPLLNACNEVAQAEHQEFDVFLARSDEALMALQRLFLLSLLLLIALAITVAVMVYRGMIAPLQARLTESQTIIDRQEKLASLGALGAGVAHEIRNPLTAIKFRLFSLKKSLPSEFSSNEDARVISEELNRLDRIVKDFLQFARPTEPDLVPVPAERILNAVHELMKPELEPAAIELKLEVMQPAWIGADTAQLKQVLINLIQNSAESIGQKGRITLRLIGGVSNFGNHSQRAAIMQIADTGKGIPATVQKRLFDPFFTTKENGTGLGLAIAARIVETHGGVLRYQTELNRGTVFEIAMPALNEHAG